MIAADAADQRGAWQAVADRTTGPGTHPAIIEASGGHPDSRPAEGDEIEVPGYDAPESADAASESEETDDDAESEPDPDKQQRRSGDPFAPR